MTRRVQAVTQPPPGPAPAADAAWDEAVAYFRSVLAAPAIEQAHRLDEIKEDLARTVGKEILRFKVAFAEAEAIAGPVFALADEILAGRALMQSQHIGVERLNQLQGLVDHGRQLRGCVRNITRAEELRRALDHAAPAERERLEADIRLQVTSIASVPAALAAQARGVRAWVLEAQAIHKAAANAGEPLVVIAYTQAPADPGPSTHAETHFDVLGRPA